MKEKRIATAILTAFTIMATPFISETHAMSVDELLDTMRDAYEQSHRDIEDYTIVTDMYTAYHKKHIVDGRPAYKTRTETSGLEDMGGAGGSATVSRSDLFDPEIYDQIRASGSYEGMETVDGTRTHVLSVPSINLPEEDIDMDVQTMQNVRLFIEPDKWVPRRITFDVDAEIEEGQIRTVSPEILMGDYRNVEGLWVPYSTTMLMEVGDDILSPEKREEARRQLAQLEQQMEQMPEQQRQMMEQMMAGQLDQLRDMLEGERMEWTINVREVKVNSGLPDSMFE